MLEINLDLYKTFFVVAKCKSMTKAADILFVSQPAISKSIKNLEDQLGTYLFNRTTKGLELTTEGELLYKRIHPILVALQNVENELSEYKELDAGEIRIGVSTVLTKCILLDALSEFKSQYPNIRFFIKNGLTSELIKDLNDGKLDFVIFNESDEIENNVNVEPLTTLNYVFFANPMYYDIDTFDDIKKSPLILQNKNSNTRKFLDKYTNNECTPDMEVVSQDLICNLVNIGMGVGFAFEKIVDAINPNFKKVTIPTIPTTNIMIATNPMSNLNKASNKFIKLLKG